MAAREAATKAARTTATADERIFVVGRDAKEKKEKKKPPLPKNIKCE